MCPSFHGRNPEEIIQSQNFFESSGRIFKALSWLDYAEKNGNVSALEYAALEARLGIEQLLFEQLVIGVGTKLEVAEYKKCSGNAKKLDQLIQRFIPRYNLLVIFTRALVSQEIPVTKWDNVKLVRYSGKISNYIHWSGGLDTTVKSSEWFNRGISMVKEACKYIWDEHATGNTGVINIESLEPDTLELWNSYASGKISIEDVIASVTDS